MRWKNYGQRSNWQRVEPRLGDPPGRAGWQFPRHFEHLPDDPWQVVMRIESTRRGMIQDLGGWLPRMGQPLFRTVLGKGRARSALQLCRRRLGRVGTLFRALGLRPPYGRCEEASRSRSDEARVVGAL